MPQCCIIRTLPFLLVSVKAWHSNSYEKAILPLLHKIQAVSFNNTHAVQFTVIHIVLNFQIYILI